MTLAEDVVALHTRLATAQRERLRAEGARDTAMSAAEAARQELQRDFDVSTVEDAEELLVRLRTDVEQLVASIAAKLDQITGATS